MTSTDDLINFDLIETHKENIQSLPGGRSAKQLANILSPLPSSKTGSEPTLNGTKTLNDAIRQEYETELVSINDSDDPLDIYDRYVKWTLNAYPSAQATPQSQLLPLLERATKAFLTSSHYKNDPRYLKLWLHYIRLFSDTPRETFAFLARHHIGETLGLFYEEFAAWLEGAERWNQADEVYRMGIEREARPAERLMRKYNQFQQRYEARPESTNEPSSPALPTVRPALAAKMDPFTSTSRTEEVMQQAGNSSVAAKPKSGKPKMAIFNDTDGEPPPMSNSGTKGWDSIGSMKERKKENTIEARPWGGETLKTIKRIGTVSKMEIFKDPNFQINESQKPQLIKSVDAVNPRTGRSERVFVDLGAIYRSQGEEYSFEELRALERGWLHKDWRTEQTSPMQQTDANTQQTHQPYKSTEPVDVENLIADYPHKLHSPCNSNESAASMPESKSSKSKKSKHREIKQETQTVKTILDSPTGKKVRRKNSSAAEPTMTFHSKAAMNDIYNIFNHSKKPTVKDDIQSGDETDNGEDTYSTAGESVGTGHISGNNSECGDDTTKSFGFNNTGSQPDNNSPWSDFTLSKHLPNRSIRDDAHHRKTSSEDITGELDASQNQTMAGFDTQAIAALANQDFGELDTKMIAQLAGNIEEDEVLDSAGQMMEQGDDAALESTQESESQNLKTPIEETLIHGIEIQEKPRFIPIPPEDYEPTPIRPYRDPTAMAQNKLPFMTPIVERTESSMAPSTIFQNPEYFASKTPSRCEVKEDDYSSPSKLHVENLLLSSPIQNSPSSSRQGRSVETEREHVSQESLSPIKQGEHFPAPGFHSIPFDVIKPVSSPGMCQDFTSSKEATSTGYALPVKMAVKIKPIHKGPIILDLQCNPCDEAVRQQILSTVHPSISTYRGYVDNEDKCFNHHSILRAFTARQKKDSSKSSPRKAQNDRTLTKVVAPSIKFSNTNRMYSIKRELGKGAYAPVYLVDSYDNLDPEASPLSLADDPSGQQTSGARGALEAMKTESPPLTLAWEFHILHLTRSRLGDASRAMASIVKAQECHLYRDECYLIIDYHSQGTLLDLVNLVRAENSRAGKSAEGLEETTAMWLSVELLRTMDELWQAGLLHGDLKIDNCLVRLDPDTELSAPYCRDGTCGWVRKGLTLIDFGRGIDTRAFKPEAKFVADWKAEETDCAEIREARPWKYEIDLFGAAGVIHSLLFGKYIETIIAGGGGLGQRKEWKLRDNLKRYWERDIWSEVFGLLINGGKLNDIDEVRRETGRVRQLMEEWLEREGERGGRDLRAAIRRCERLIKSR